MKIFPGIRETWILHFQIDQNDALTIPHLPHLTAPDPL